MFSDGTTGTTARQMTLEARIYDDPELSQNAYKVKKMCKPWKQSVVGNLLSQMIKEKYVACWRWVEP
ncbi:hypothetical protein M0802_007233 [Mischocyttarus mexicanus]|nr:hypothetical protein M0802_007233 [Mischocyttarus mexicanus]